jgi:hypothetical protein
MQQFSTTSPAQPNTSNWSPAQFNPPFTSTPQQEIPGQTHPVNLQSSGSYLSPMHVSTQTSFRTRTSQHKVDEHAEHRTNRQLLTTDYSPHPSPQPSPDPSPDSSPDPSPQPWAQQNSSHHATASFWPLNPVCSPLKPTVHGSIEFTIQPVVQRRPDHSPAIRVVPSPDPTKPIPTVHCTPSVTPTQKQPPPQPSMQATQQTSSE